MSHPTLTPAQAERLEMLAEEASEISQICMKILRHGRESYRPEDASRRPNRLLLEDEITDLGGVIYGMLAAGDMSKNFGKIGNNGAAWERKLRYTHHQTTKQSRATPCPSCGGTGGCLTDPVDCPRCDGEGYVS